MTATTHLAALAALLDVDAAARDWCDEHDRADLRVSVSTGSAGTRRLTELQVERP